MFALIKTRHLRIWRWKVRTAPKNYCKKEYSNVLLFLPLASSAAGVLRIYPLHGSHRNHTQCCRWSLAKYRDKACQSNDKTHHWVTWMQNTNEWVNKCMSVKGFCMQSSHSGIMKKKWTNIEVCNESKFYSNEHKLSSQSNHVAEWKLVEYLLSYSLSGLGLLYCESANFHCKVTKLRW